MKKIIILVLLLIIATVIGIVLMNHTSVFTFESSIDDDECLRDLQVNVKLHFNYQASNWYSYHKNFTVINEGKIIIPKIQAKEVSYIIIDATAPRCKLHHQEEIDNIYISSPWNVTNKYLFKRDFIQGEYKIGFDQFASNLQYDKNFINTSTTQYSNDNQYIVEPLDNLQISDISRLYTFDQLKTEGKLLASDINRLSNLSEEQKNELIKIHSQKQFNSVPTGF